MDLIELGKSLSGAPLAVLLILVLIGGYKGWWVFGRELTSEKERCKALLDAAAIREADWRDLALGGMSTARTAVETMKSRK
jgi:hypothetical protein